MAKFEKPLAIKRMDEILYHCDAAMVARGDLGVEMPPEEVPIIQKRIVQSCRDFGKPVVVFTRLHVINPGLVIEIPLNSFFQPLFNSY